MRRSIRLRPRRNLPRLTLLGVLTAAVAALGADESCQVNAAVVDDFSDMDDTLNPTWTHLNGLVGSSGQSWNASTGEYNLSAPNNGAAIGENGQLGFVGSYVGPVFTDVRVTADFVQPATGVAYGVAARLDGNNAINALKGYAYAYEPFAAGGLGEMVLYRVTGASLADIGSQQVTLDLANKDYTFVLQIVGDQLHGQVFEIGGGLVAERFAADATYASGYSGVFGYSAAISTLPTNFTIDNFSDQVPEPASSLLFVLSAGLLGLRAYNRRR